MIERWNVLISFQYDKGVLPSHEACVVSLSLPHVLIKHAKEDIINEIRIYRFNAIARRLTFLHNAIERERKENQSRLAHYKILPGS